MMPSDLIAPGYAGWWRITEAGTWVNKYLAALDPSMSSQTGRGDRLRMHGAWSRRWRGRRARRWRDARRHDRCAMKAGRSGRLREVRSRRWRGAGREYRGTRSVSAGRPSRARGARVGGHEALQRRRRRTSCVIIDKRALSPRLGHGCAPDRGAGISWRDGGGDE